MTERITAVGHLRAALDALEAGDHAGDSIRRDDAALARMAHTGWSQSPPLAGGGNQEGVYTLAGIALGAFAATLLFLSVWPTERWVR